MIDNILKTAVICVVVVLVLMLVLSACGFENTSETDNPQPDRFIEVYKQNGHGWDYSTIYMDTVTGVLYYFQKDGYGAGLSVLYDADGNVAHGKQE